MGQRLNIEIYLNGAEEPQANAYYHWSAYTVPALVMVKQVIDAESAIQNENDVIRSVRFLEETGAKLLKEDHPILNSIDPNERFEEANDRNAGLISISEKGIANTRLWTEGSALIDFEKEIVDFDTWSYYEKDEYIEYYSEEDYNECPEWPFDYDPLDGISFDRIEELIDYLNDLIDEKGIYGVKLPENSPLDLITFVA